MIKALKVTMIVYAAIGILFGLAMIIIPQQVADWFKGPDLADYEKYLTAAIGLANIAAAVFILMAAPDPIKKASWVQFAIAWAVIWVAGVAYGLGRGYVTFEQQGVALILHIVFGVLLLIFYPWKARRGTA